MVSAERRRFPRVQDDMMTLSLSAGGFDIATHTLNISASGLYCKVSKEIPIMSRVKLMLKIPTQSKDEKSAVGLELEGVVVRQHPVIIDGQTKHYDIAIFFDSLSDKDRAVISEYIARKKG